MKRKAVSPDTWQYGDRSAATVRGTLLGLVLEFVREVRGLPGVHRIALVGSLATDKARPKDADVLVCIDAGLDLGALARAGRRLKGRAQGINSGADVFLAEVGGRYLGRVCPYRECHPRVQCRARHCRARAHLNDDLDVVTLSAELLASPSVLLYPTVASRQALPPDVELGLLTPLRALLNEPGSSPTAATRTI